MPWKKIPREKGECERQRAQPALKGKLALEIRKKNSYPRGRGPGKDHSLQVFVGPQFIS